MLITMSQTTRWRLQMSCFLCPTIQNRNILSLPSSWKNRKAAVSQIWDAETCLPFLIKHETAHFWFKNDLQMIAQLNLISHLVALQKSIKLVIQSNICVLFCIASKQHAKQRNTCRSLVTMTISCKTLCMLPILWTWQQRNILFNTVILISAIAPGTNK